ncbi:uncharacterized protein [Mytilus edulis]|uniref:uncharacterized protein n=1 Tax=Mytilus edulis TaxID=6550 RepID=UPI0039F13FF7
MTTWIQIENFQCPGKDCRTKTVGKTWLCANDRTPVFMSQTGYIRCNQIANIMTYNDASKYSHYDKICNWRWDCGNHGDHPFTKFMEADKESFILSMSMALQMVKTKGKAKWISALVLELGNQFGEEDSDDDLT